MNITELKGCPENYRELDKSFSAIFQGAHINYFLDGLVGIGMFSFDIMKFDDWYKKYIENYEDGKTSLKDAIEKKFGKETMELIQKLIS